MYNSSPSPPPPSTASASAAAAAARSIAAATSLIRSPPPLTAAPPTTGLIPTAAAAAGSHPGLFFQHRMNMSMTAAFSHLLPGSESVYESAAKLLFMCVKWAKSVPSFVQLPESDQTLLMEDGWSQLFILGLAQWNVQFEEGKCDFAWFHDRVFSGFFIQDPSFEKACPQGRTTPV